MPKLDKLIQELCPDGVETKKLKDFLVIKNGSDYKSFGAGDYPVYGSGGIMTYIDRYAYDKPSVLIPRKGSIDKLYYVEKPFWNVDTIFYTEIDTTKAIPRYVYYCLQQKHLEEYNTAGGVPSLTQKVLNNIEILVPPLGIQHEIVRMLDSYTESVVELQRQLTAELTARKAQYSHYRDKLLSYTSTTQMEKLGDTCEMKAGKAIASGLISDECTEETPIKCYGGNGVRGYVSEQREKELAKIIQEEKLKEPETRKYLANAFRDGEIKTVGTDIDKLMPPVSRFGGGGRAQKKQGVIDKLKSFFDKFFGIGGSSMAGDDKYQ